MTAIKQRLKSLLRATFRVGAEGVPEPLLGERERLGFYTRVDQGTQILLRLKYQEMLRRGDPLPPFHEVEFRSYSQNGEDGILLYIFSLIGTTNKRAVEICAGDGMECNAANLIINHGWHALLFDGSDENVKAGRHFYARHRNTWVSPPTLAQAWVTRDNVNRLIKEQGFAGDIDLLSIDIDGNDYWIWDAIDAVSPRVVLVEYNNLSKTPATIPYQEDFVADLTQPPPYYLGATLAAFVKLGRSKGYRLVGGQRLGFNAFFVKDGVGQEALPEVPVSSVASEPIAASLELFATREFTEV